MALNGRKERQQYFQPCNVKPTTWTFRQSAGQDLETVGPLWNHSHVGVSPMLTYNPNSRAALKWLHFCVGPYDR